MIEIILYLLSGLLAGFLISWIVSRVRKKAMDRDSGQYMSELRNELGVYRNRIEEKDREIIRLSSLLAAKETRLEVLDEKLLNQKKELTEIKETMTREFRLMASEIMEEKSEKFTRNNREKLDEILKPFNDNLKDFREKVEKTRMEEREGRASLFTRLAELEKLNTRISNEANALTKALKGESKTQGNWGEMILESVLEKSGLVRDREFFVQESFRAEDGKRLVPDVVVKYPGDRSIIIDSKVSLVAYERYVNSDDEADRQEALKAHISSIRSHIIGLSGKQYQSEYRINTLDFVMMFMPVEPAYLLALQKDDSLWSFAYEKRILLISPTNLIAALRMIESIWRQEYQNRNVMEIARQGGALYDDFVLMVERMDKLGKKIDDTRLQYEDTMKKLTGRGNLISRVSKLSELGVKTRKSMPDKFRDDELPPEEEANQKEA